MAFDAAAGGPADLGGRRRADRSDIRTRPSRSPAPADRRCAAAKRARLHMDPGGARGGIEQHGRGDQKSGATADAGVPRLLDGGGIAARVCRCRCRKVLRARDALDAVVALAIRDVAFGAQDPIPDLPIVAEIYARPERRRAETGRIVGHEARTILRNKIQRAADAARCAGARDSSWSRSNRKTVLPSATPA